MQQSLFERSNLENVHWRISRAPERSCSRSLALASLLAIGNADVEEQCRRGSVTWTVEDCPNVVGEYC